LLNFLALLGWSPGTDQEVFGRRELVDVFALDRISGGGAVFDLNKLEWFNQQHIARLARDELAVRIRSSFEAAGLWDESYLGERHAWFFAVLELLKPRVRRMGDFVTQGRFFFTDQIEYDAAALEKYLRSANVAEHLP